MDSRQIFARPARLAAFLPCLWMLLFFLLPFGFVLKLSLSHTVIAQPPYAPLIPLMEGWRALRDALGQLDFSNFGMLASDELYVMSYLRSVTVAALSTILLLAIGYPIAYGMARLPPSRQPVAMMLVIVPFWTSFLIRI